METLVNEKNKSILESLQSQKNDDINYLYREYYPSIKHMIISNSGTSFDAQDVFQEALLIIIQKARNNDLELTCSIKTYLYSICYNMWLRQLSRKSKEVILNDTIEIFDDTDHDQRLLDEKLYEIYRLNFEMLSPEYQKILNMYLSHYSMNKITEEMGYKNENYSKVRKYLCKEKLKKNIHNDQEYKELRYIYSN